MKTTTIIAVLSVLLVVALFGVGKSFTTPTETRTEKTIKLLEYSHEGAFDYAVTALPSSLYGDTQPAASEPLPISAIEQFNVSFSFQSPAPPPGPIEVSAILESTGTWKKTVNLAGSNNTGTLDVSFPLDLKSLQATGDTISKEIGAGAASFDLTLQAVVRGGTTSLDGAAADFVQLLPIRMTRTVVRIGDSLVLSQGGARGEFSYQVRLGENTLYGPITIASPPPSTPSGDILGPEDTVFIRLIDSMEMSYSYRLAANKAPGNTETEVKIEAVVENPDRWSKTYVLVPPTREDGDFSVSFPLDLEQFTAVFDDIQRETGVSASSHDVSLVATVRTVAQTSEGQLDETFTQSIKTNLREGVMAWEGEMKKSSPGSFDTVQVVVEPGRLFGRPIAEVRIISAALAVVMLGALAYCGRLYMRRRTDETALAAEKAREVGRKYKSMIVEVSERPEKRYGETILPVESLDDLVKVSQGLLKPVNHRHERDQHVYWVYDDHTRYEFSLSLPKAISPSGKEPGTS